MKQKRKEKLKKENAGKRFSLDDLIDEEAKLASLKNYKVVSLNLEKGCKYVKYDIL